MPPAIEVQICMNLYVFGIPDSSRVLVEPVFHDKSDFWFLSQHDSEISNNFFWVISIFSFAKICTELNFAYQITMYISTLNPFPGCFSVILRNWHFSAYQLVGAASKPRRGVRFGHIRESASHQFGICLALVVQTCGTPLSKQKGRWGCEALSASLNQHQQRSNMQTATAKARHWWVGKKTSIFQPQH